MKRDYILAALSGWIVPILTTTATCPCWNEIIRDVHPSSKVAASGLCENPSLFAQRFEECVTRERCGSLRVRDQERWFRELCDTDRDDVGLRRAEELRRRADGDDNSNSNSISIENDNTPDDTSTTTTEDVESDTPTPTPTPKKASVTTDPIKSPTKHPTKPPATSIPPPTKTAASSSSTSSPKTTGSSTTSTESSSTSTTTSVDTTSTPTSSPTAPAASATQTSTSSGPAMGPASIAAATIFSAFAAGCIGFLAFVCFRRVRRSRQSQKKGPMGEQLLGGAAKSSSGGSYRNVSGSSRSIHDTQSMFSDHNDSAASIPLADRHSGYAQRLYPLGSNAYHPAPQYEPRDTYNPNGDHGDLGQQPTAYSIYSQNPAPEQYHSYWSPPNAQSSHDQGWNAAPIAPIRNMRSGSGSSSHLNLPASLTPGEQHVAYGTSGSAAGGYSHQYTPTTTPPGSRFGS
ncbi:MAG: hypothetical protein M1813_002637 [Trichoglossum hirsutum]|nr:MAG: hypothetical protein M1813_002637 [Trichoglossum hirsutum]